MRRPSGAGASGGGALAKWENNFASIESGDIFRALKPAKMMIMAKHSRIAIIKSRKNGGTLLLLAAAAMHVMGASVSAQDTPDFAAIRSVDTDIEAIGYRLATANAPLCDRQEQGLGLSIPPPDQYAQQFREG